MNIRIASILAVTLVLAGCTNPLAKKDDFQTIVKSHYTAMGNSLNTESLQNYVGKMNFEGNLTAQSKNQGFAIDYKTESKVRLADSDVTLNLSGSINVPGTPQVSAEAIMRAIFASGTGYVQLTKVELTGMERSPMFDGMIENAMRDYGNKWFTLPSGDKATLANAQVNSLAVKAAFEKYPVLAMSKDLGYNEGTYNYEVSLDNTGALALAEELGKILTGTGLTQANLDSMKKEIANYSLTGKLSINDSNRAYGTFVGNITHTTNIPGGAPVTELITLSYNNSADTFNFDTSASGEKIVIAVTKELTKANGTVTYTDMDKKPIVIKFTIEKTLAGYSFSASGDIDLPTGEQMSIKTNGNVSTQKDETIKIEAPKESMDLNKAIGGLLGGTPIPAPSVENQVDAAALIQNMDDDIAPLK